MGLSLVSATARLLVDPILAVVFPSFCPVCGSVLDRPTRGPLCRGCWETLPRHQGRLCRCGLPLPPGLELCGRCRRGLQPFAAGFSLGPYEGSLRTAIHELKYRGRRRVAARMAEALLLDAQARGLLAGAEVLLPVPLHPRRRRERGFNQSELLAAEVGRRTGLAVVGSALVRRKDTVAQTGLSAAQRRQNVAGAFSVRKRAAVEGRVIVLFDDVFTTGATALACAAALRSAGAREVRLLCLARVV